jgi:hypothetical protein
VNHFACKKLPSKANARRGAKDPRCMRSERANELILSLGSEHRAKG